ncbi:MAG: hypothetical protein KF716_06815 [Anaerolineae bacterium]|nr:hypothetical protein [Anaerolineae bacterium]
MVEKGAGQSGEATIMLKWLGKRQQPAGLLQKFGFTRRLNVEDFDLVAI